MPISNPVNQLRGTAISTPLIPYAQYVGVCLCLFVFVCGQVFSLWGAQQHQRSRTIRIYADIMYNQKFILYIYESSRPPYRDCASCILISAPSSRSTKKTLSPHHRIVYNEYILYIYKSPYNARGI